MKLRTEINRTAHGYPSFWYDDDSLKHDAAVAHALVVATGELMGKTPHNYANVWHRANELLAEWGFGEEEDERG